ncbi:hypothetical protein AWB99_14175 [Mycolicibacterium confluentis]|uniref:Uncharacterized protein n=1 Tax=Mycolicibacterium confluentis TaxID=28047 RepID=A0A7I7Y1Y1_9MYCO|nr:hypothetical protein AWB99_14175 [Mycolicibacterium confluentis]BBZ35635.1 hypothetical protein MCNF_42400 [Mycolicibacterium confluentis]
MVADLSTNPVRWEESRGVVTLVLDDPTQRVNTLNTALVEALAEAIDRLGREQDRIDGVILRSAKRSFLAGGDLNRLLAVQPADIHEFTADLDLRKALYRRLELYPKPVVALIDGPALGGGLELALCCHHRIGVDNGRTVVGLPEIGLGLFPGAGGTVRTVRRLGLTRALKELLLSGRQLNLTEAMAAGLIDEPAVSLGRGEQLAREWIASKPTPLPRTPDVAPAELASSAVAVSTGANRAAELLIEVAVESVKLKFDDAMRLESAVFGELVVDPATKNCIRTHFFDTGALRRRVTALGSSDVVRPVVTPLSPAVNDMLRKPSWAAVIDVAGLESGGGHGLDADARMSWDGCTAPTQVWFYPDAVGDGQRVIECGRTGEEDPLLVALAKSGVLTIPLTPGAGPYGRRVQEAIASVYRRHLDISGSPEHVRQTACWAGLTSEARTSITGPPVDFDLVCSLLNEVAERAVAAGAALDDAADLDVASVRSGGFPGWTGGVRRWLDEGTKTLTEMIELRERKAR